jgi:hypothetical protein
VKLETKTQADVKDTPLSSQVKQEPIVNNSTDKTGDHVKKGGSVILFVNQLLPCWNGK